MDVSVVCVGAEGLARTTEVGAAMASAGRGTGPGARTLTCPDPSARMGLDQALDAAAHGRLVVCATVGDLAAVLRRMWRRGELVERETAWLPIGPVPPYLRGWGMPTSLEAAAEVATSGSVQTVGLLADDSGGLVVDSADVCPWRGRRLWVRAFVDDEKVCDGDVSGLRVDRPGTGVLRVRALGRFGRTLTQIDGRAAQLVCDEAALSSDGVARTRPRRKRIWWNEPDLWRLTLPRHASHGPDATG